MFRVNILVTEAANYIITQGFQQIQNISLQRSMGVIVGSKECLEFIFWFKASILEFIFGIKGSILEFIFGSKGSDLS